MSDTRLKYLFFVTKPYSFAILEPIYNYINDSDSGEIAWFKASTAISIIPNGKLLKTTEEVMNYNPDAVLVPGNIVPNFWPGIKVQIFHGMDDEVKGFYDITGQFDLYCSHGRESTKQFKQLSKKYKYFAVEETGWPKLDPLFDGINSKLNLDKKMIKEIGFDNNKPILLYAPTFPPKYTSAYDLFEDIAKLRDKYQWMVKFHTLMDNNIQNKYRSLSCESFKIIDENNILPYFVISDILITDTSSVGYEFLPLDRPIITYKAIARKDKGVDIINPKDLHGAIIRSFEYPQEFSDNRNYYLDELHSFSDGKSSKRVVEVIENFINNNILSELSSKPMNTIRNRKARKIVSANQ